MFWSFHPLADKTNNDHLPKPFFKVTRKSLILQRKKSSYANFDWTYDHSHGGNFVCRLWLSGSNCFPYQNFKKWRKTPLDQTLSYSTWGWVTLNTKASFSMNALLTLWSAVVLTIYMEKTKIIPGWKIKWFPPFRLGSFRKYGLSSEATRYFYPFLFVKLIWIVAGRSHTMSDFLV